jgi:glycosyltransferase involved in cell wall biosynthesis
MSAVETAAPPTVVRESGDPVRVVHLVLTLNFGGLEKVVYDLVRSTDPQRFSVRVLCLGEIGTLGPAFEAIGVPVESLDVHGRGMVRGIVAVAKRLRDLRPDVLHTHNPAPQIFGAPAARLTGVPVVVYTRHGQHRQEGWRAALGNRLATRLTDCLVAVSADAAAVARLDDGVSDSKLEIIHNGIDLERFSFVPGRRTADRYRAIHVARLDNAIKDQVTLLNAAKIVAAAEPGFVLDIVGDGPSRPELETLCKDLRLDAHVKFLGYREDVQECLKQAGLFVLSSVTEGLSISILEAMAMGLPVVATRVGGNPELVRHGTNGLLVPARDPQALAAAILELLTNPEKSNLMGEASRRLAEDEFDLQRVAARYEGLYLKLLKRSSRQLH